MTKIRQSLGRWGEDLAARYLVEHGYTLVDRNARTPYGEVDVVAYKEDETGSGVVVFVEVKTRSSKSFGLPEQSITSRKQEHLISSAQFYLQEHPELGQDWRIDVIAIRRYRTGKTPEITVFENAFGQE